MRRLLLFLFLWMPFAGMGQDTIQGVVFLKAVEIVDVQDDFNAEDFIAKVIDDTTFHKAFLNLRYYQHNSVGNLEVYKKEEKSIGKLYRQADHKKEGDQFWVDVTKEKVKGKVVNRKGEYKYYTAKMFDHAFYPADTLYASNIVAENELPNEHDTKMQKRKNDIRMMMFNPGAKIDNVPVVGKKMAIFDDEMAVHYNYKIWYFNYRDSIPCYALSCEAKAASKPDDTVVKELTSYFHAETMEIMKREYHMKYKHMLFDFDVYIDVDLKKIGTALVPEVIRYTGWWDVPMHKKEHIKFDVSCFNFQIR